MCRKQKFGRGFTLIELLVVVVIIATLAGIAILRYQGVVEQARAAKAWSTLSDIINAEKRYFLENNSYTATLTDLDIYGTDPSLTDDDFDYSFANPWAIANRTKSGGGRLSYRLDLNGTKQSIDGTY
jgi:type IV pilus assembly protein PilE